ncbi:hypothetical protein [Methylobacterium sp.]|uniref:hypothetical protein n=1 Tax=Methylobacterium sp. TaxID=409 RepID=UPI0025FB129E|nr:hypothetical protein [Methylobacterium sp.]MBY0259573.1 hypothetical protein [Methylobacterium sp.]
MLRIELVAGDFGTGTAWYEAGEFKLPKRRLQSIANVSAIEANATVIEKHWGRALIAGAKNAAGLAPLAMVVGIFAAPLAAVGAIGIGAAAIGGALGLLGGGAETKALVQVTFEQGTGFVGICEIATAETMRNDAALIRAEAERQLRLTEPPKRRWFSKATPPETVPQARALPAPHPVDAQVEEQGTLAGIGDGLSAAAATAGSAVTTAADATGQALSGAFAFAKRAAGLDEKKR